MFDNVIILGGLVLGGTRAYFTSYRFDGEGSYLVYNEYNYRRGFVSLLLYMNYGFVLDYSSALGTLYRAVRAISCYMVVCFRCVSSWRGAFRSYKLLLFWPVFRWGWECVWFGCAVFFGFIFGPAMG